MIVKRLQRTASHLTLFDLLGTDETALSKAFAYILAKEKDALFTFLRFLGVPTKNTDRNFFATSIEIERSRPEGHTDVEILRPGSFHVIAECKVHKGKIGRQRTQYLTAFEDVANKVMCFITQERDTNKEKRNGIVIRSVSWMDILDVFENARLASNTIVRQFMMYAMRTYKMKSQGEILVQDLSDPIELCRYQKYSLYRRDVTFGSPLYFAPHFTRKAPREIGVGIKYLSRVLGVLTLNPSDISDYRNDLESFSEKPDQANKWEKGVEMDGTSDQASQYTFYFLDEPVELPFPLLKDKSKEKGSGKNWISRMISKNRCVPFAELIRQITLQSRG